MSERLMGLLGSGQGPYISTRVLGKKVHARVTGLRKGQVTVEVTDMIEGSNAVLHHISDNGTHEIPSGSYMRVRCDDGNPTMICTLRKAAS